MPSREGMKNLRCEITHHFSAKQKYKLDALMKVQAEEEKATQDALKESERLSTIQMQKDADLLSRRLIKEETQKASTKAILIKSGIRR